MDELLGFGQLRVPVMTSGERWVFAGNLDDVADFLGIARSGHRMLEPRELVERYDAILEAAQRSLRAFPPQHIGMTVPRRDQRDMRQLGYHVFAIADDLMRVKEGDDYAQGNGPVPDAVRSFGDIAAYGDDVRERLREWFVRQPPDLWSQTRTTSYGAYPMHFYLERAVWHSAQHARQIVAMMKSAGVDAPEPLLPALLVGLPMPERIWE